jgi:hypothetical protein
VALLGDLLVVEEAAGFFHELADGGVVLVVVGVVVCVVRSVWLSLQCQRRV